MAATKKRPVVEDAATTRGRNAAQGPGEFSFQDQFDYITFTGRLLRQSKMKYSHIAKATHMSPTTASNMANAVTRYPRFGTVSNLLSALGYETIIRSGAAEKPPKKIR